MVIISIVNSSRRPALLPRACILVCMVEIEFTMSPLVVIEASARELHLLLSQLPL